MTGQEAEELPALPEDLAAICLDANAMSKGRLNLDAIRGLLEVIESQEFEFEVWVPEPVLWEWAEHLAADLRESRARYEAVREQAEVAGAGDLLDGQLDTSVGVDAIVAQLEAALDELDQVRILKLSKYPSAAIDGLRDQVLLQGAGRRKSNVKAGAADSASFRLAQEELKQWGGSLLVVSGDQDAEAHFVSIPNVLVVKSLSRAKAGVVGMRPGSEVALERVTDAIRLKLPTLMAGQFADVSIEGNLGQRETGRLRGRVVHSELGLQSIDRVGSVENVEVSRSDGFATAMVEAGITVVREQQVLSDINGMVEMDLDSFDDVPAMVEVSAESADGLTWNIVVDGVRVG